MTNYDALRAAGINTSPLENNFFDFDKASLKYIFQHNK
jgi:hypothetical protein